MRFCGISLVHSQGLRIIVTYIQSTVLGPVLGRTNPEAAAKADKLLTASLSSIENIWLTDNGKYLLGSSQPSIADLSLVCEVMQLEVLNEKDINRFLGPHRKVLQWIEDMRNATNPHFDEIHKAVFEVKAKYNNVAESSIRAMLPSKPDPTSTRLHASHGHARGRCGADSMCSAGAIDTLLTDRLEYRLVDLCKGGESGNRDEKFNLLRPIYDYMMKRLPTRFTILSFTCVSLFLFGFVIAIPQKTSVLRTPTEKPLQFSSNSSFKIALFSDLHYGENSWTDWGPRQDAKSDRVMSTVLDQEEPDFVVYLGDLITANNLPIQNATLYWDRAISPTRARGIPWATVFGNHDDMPFEWPIEWFSASGIPQLRCPTTNSPVSGEEECSFRGTQRVELMKKEIEQNWLSNSVNGPQELWPGVSNYVLQVSSSDGPRLPVAFLYFLDSGGGSYLEVISNAQARWFQNTSQELNPELSVPEIIFWHIPSKAYKEVAPFFWIFKPCVGSLNKESVAAQEAEMGIMDFLANRPAVKKTRRSSQH
ncbi:hypothetical protein NE237_003332 [Protea cynaroides]|uniref:GST C-terminal domain-containing protein n=1 Tax=Protea cynaroides TaxID=273540 RepID=A0A9Q0KGI4_9MAGN|nr:hypothetical protein NE237_003332 [Protea cynaroides]